MSIEDSLKGRPALTEKQLRAKLVRLRARVVSLVGEGDTLSFGGRELTKAAALAHIDEQLSPFEALDQLTRQVAEQRRKLRGSLARLGRLAATAEPELFAELVQSFPLLAKAIEAARPPNARTRNPAERFDATRKRRRPSSEDGARAKAGRLKS